MPTPESIAAPVAFVEDHVSVAHFPAWIEAGLAERVTVGFGGGGAGVTSTTVVPDADPPGPFAVIP